MSKDIIPTWMTLSKFGKIRIFKSSYFWMIFVPLCANLFDKINETIDVVIFGQYLTLSITLPFSWKMFYFSSVLISLAMAIYATMCPEIIKEYETFTDFHNAGKTECQVKDYFIEYINNSEHENILKNQVKSYLNYFTTYELFEEKTTESKNNSRFIETLFEKDWP